MIPLWLDGLYVSELYQISKADRFEILHHIYGEHRIADVRRVQELRPIELVFPVSAVDPKSHVGAGGDPKVRRYR